MSQSILITNPCLTSLSTAQRFANVQALQAYCAQHSIQQQDFSYAPYSRKLQQLLIVQHKQETQLSYLHMQLQLQNRRVSVATARTNAMLTGVHT